MKLLYATIVPSGYTASSVGVIYVDPVARVNLPGEMLRQVQHDNGRKVGARYYTVSTVKIAVGSQPVTRVYWPVGSEEKG